MTYSVNDDLHDAARVGDLTTIQRLLAEGADPEDWSDQDDAPALVVAAASGHAEAVDLLLDSGASIEGCMEYGETAVIEGDGFVLVADPTWLPQEVEEIAQHVRSIRAGRQLYLLFTHSDFDHILGYGVFPDATVIASQAFADNPDKARCVDKVREWDSEYYVSRPYDVLYPDVDIAAKQDGQQIDVEGTLLTFYRAPGHNPDGLFTVIEPHGILLAGDYLSDVEFPFVYQSSVLYESTLHKLDGIRDRHHVSLLVPGHGQVATTQEEMRSRQQASFDYIHSLRQHIAAGNQVAIDAMLYEYAFPHGMKAFHEGNQSLMQAEASHAR